MKKVDTMVAKMKKLETLKKLISAIEHGDIDLIEIKEKHNKDLTWSVSMKILSHKEAEELKKYTYTFSK